MKNWITLTLLSALAACSAPTPANYAVASKVAGPDVSSASYHTFSFGPAEPPRPGYEVTPQSLEVQRRLHSLVKTALEQRGMTETRDNPDVVVKLATGSGSGYQLRPSGSAGVRPEQRSGPVPAVSFVGIDIYSGMSGIQIWQGSAFAEIERTKVDDTLLRTGVDHMLEGFASVRAD